MRVRVLLFAAYRDLGGFDEAELDLPCGATGASLISELRARGGGLAKLPVRPAIAVNQEYAELDAVLFEGDEVALLPPVAGG